MGTELELDGKQNRLLAAKLKKWDTLSIGLSIEVVVDANESQESCPRHSPHLWKPRLGVVVESVFQE